MENGNQKGRTNVGAGGNELQMADGIEEMDVQSDVQQTGGTEAFM